MAMPSTKPQFEGEEDEISELVVWLVLSFTLWTAAIFSITFLVG